MTESKAVADHILLSVLQGLWVLLQAVAFGYI